MGGVAPVAMRRAKIREDTQHTSPKLVHGVRSRDKRKDGREALGASEKEWNVI